jgi:tellurium resistance protein TerZ
LTLSQLPPIVDCMYLVLSAWTNNLGAILNPYIRLVEQSTAVELCSYQLERAGTSQAVVMAKVVRQLAGWKVMPIGVTSYGTVRDYRPIRETIDNVNRTGKEQ